ncbi:hypothetical protein, partial [Paenibacillus alba]
LRGRTGNTGVIPVEFEFAASRRAFFCISLDKLQSKYYFHLPNPIILELFQWNLATGLGVRRYTWSL